MRLTVLGCSGTWPSPTSACSGYLVEHDGFRLVLDLGNGSVGELQRHCALTDVDAVWVSHLHADHCLDLLPLSYALRYGPGGPAPALEVHGPPGLAARLARAYEAPPTDGLEAVYDVREVRPGAARLGPFTVTAARVAHPVEAYGVRLEAGGRTLVYSGDTGESDALVALAGGADLLLCEATWPSSPEPPPGIHLTGAQAGEHATRAGAARLLLTHVSPATDPQVVLAEARATYSGPLGLAARGQVHEV